MINYDSNEAIYHTINNEEKNKEKNKAIHFNDGINIEDLYYDLKKIIMDKLPTEFGYVDKYFVDYESQIGIDQGYDTNIVKVVTLGGTKDIIAIYPFHAKVEQIEKLK